MTRISVAGAIRFAYGFAFEQIGAIIGLVWLPLVLVAILQFLPYAIGTAYPGADPGEEGRAAALNLTFSTVVLVLYAMNCVAVTRQALGQRQGTASVHFTLGKPEWRMFAAIVICGLILAASVGIYIMVGSGLVAAARTAPLLAIAAGVYVVAGLCAIAWLALRLIFLLPPIVVVEERVDFLRAWMLSRGNVWRFFLVMAAVTVPLLLVQSAAIIAIVGPGILAPLPDNSVAMTAALQARVAMVDRHMATIIGLALVLAPFSLGLTLGAASYAYRALTSERPASNPWPEQ
ncbi:MAG TPA: hypothetical protein VHY79_13280 [Rhizomicrobium sp.]|jgi:hypothetical protein|nr:hypothetical protein [Rhizomicrobium sp.]